MILNFCNIGITSILIVKNWYCKSQKEIQKWQQNKLLLFIIMYKIQYLYQ